MRAPVSVGVLASVLVWAAAAHAELRYRVVLLRPTVTDDVTSDAVARVRGELTAAGFDVSELGQTPALDVRTALETVGRELDPIGAFAIVRAPAGNTAEIWVCDRMAGKSVIQSVRLDSDSKPGEPSRAVVLAVQAVELLKASLAQYWLASVRRSSRPAAGVIAPPPPPSHVTAGLGVEAGVGWLDSVGAVTAVWQPLVRASYGSARGWGARVTIAGLGQDAVLRAPAGSATIRQQLGAIELRVGLRAGKAIQLVVSAGAGAYNARVSGEGSGSQNYNNNVRTLWSALGIAGGGVVIPILPHLSLAGDAQIGLTWPDNLIRIVGTEAGRTGRPLLLVSAGVLATF